MPSRPASPTAAPRGSKRRAAPHLPPFARAARASGLPLRCLLRQPLPRAHRGPRHTLTHHTHAPPAPQEGECFAACAALDTHKSLVHVFFAQRSTKKARARPRRGRAPLAARALAVFPCRASVRADAARTPPRGPFAHAPPYKHTPPGPRRHRRRPQAPPHQGRRRAGRRAHGQRHRDRARAGGGQRGPEGGQPAVPGRGWLVLVWLLFCTSPLFRDLHRCALFHSGVRVPRRRDAAAHPCAPAHAPALEATLSPSLPPLTPGWHGPHQGQPRVARQEGPHGAGARACGGGVGTKALRGGS